MRLTVGAATLELVEGDIVQQETEAIVNAANSSLLGGGGGVRFVLFGRATLAAYQAALDQVASAGDPA